MNRFAVRDQENLLHTQQTTAAAKQISQNARILGSKIPANKIPKTPLRKPYNNENVPIQKGKSVLRKLGNANENSITKSTVKDVSKKLPLTPKGPQNRAPLGNKTTNAKAKAFQTPVHPKKDAKPLSQTSGAKSRSPRNRRAKVKVFQPTANIVADEEPEPDIEYMPPKPQDIPDVPDDEFPLDMDFPQLKGANLTRGWLETYIDPIEDDGRRRSERLRAEDMERFSKEQDDILLKSCQSITFDEKALTDADTDVCLLEDLFEESE